MYNQIIALSTLICKHMKKIVKKKIKEFLLARKYKLNSIMFENYFKRIINSNPKLETNPDKQTMDLWMEKWSVFGQKPTEYGFKAFNSYMNGNIDFVPNDIGRNFIEPILTPEEYQPFYNDKNSFGLFINKEWMPKTFFRSMKGMLYNGDYEPVKSEDFLKLFEGVDKLVVKPAKDMGGKGVTLFTRNNKGIFTDNKGKELNLEYLEKTYNTEYLIQECIKQSEYMAQFNPTSVNTLRIAVYRDVKTGALEVIGAVIRIGGKGSFVDNICSGGSFIYVDNNGKLSNFACNEHGNTYKIHNGIDFEKNEFVIPDFEKIKQFVFEVAKRMPHMNLFANDVAIDENGSPKLIEVNTIMFSYWLYQFFGKPVFGEHTDEIIEYCLKENEKITPKVVLKYD